MLKTFLAFIVSAIFYLPAFSQSDTVTAYNYFQKGLHQEGIKHYQQALNEFDTAVMANSNYSRTYFHRAYVQYRLNNFDASIDDYTPGQPPLIITGDIPNTLPAIIKPL
jgi:tetratricopeptide (TPR) repeat protein